MAGMFISVSFFFLFLFASFLRWGMRDGGKERETDIIIRGWLASRDKLSPPPRSWWRVCQGGLNSHGRASLRSVRNEVSTQVQVRNYIGGPGSMRPRVAEGAHYGRE